MQSSVEKNQVQIQNRLTKPAQQSVKRTVCHALLKRFYLLEIIVRFAGWFSVANRRLREPLESKKPARWIEDWQIVD